MTLLYDPGLYLLAEQLNAIEELRKATANRLRQATRSTADKDGETRGLGLPDSHPAVVHTAVMLESLEQIEKATVRDLQQTMRQHPLGQWQHQQRGIGEKQLARLLACIGDPYWNTLHDRPRTVSELWAYCGLHTLPAGHWWRDTHTTPTSEADASRHPDHRPSDAHGPGVWVAARRRRGQKSNWSAEAKARLRMIAESMLKAGNRGRYDKRRTVTADRTHQALCVQCGPPGKPAQPGTAWKPGHQHSDALRIVAKYDVLVPLFETARDIHQVTEHQ